MAKRESSPVNPLDATPDELTASIAESQSPLAKKMKISELHTTACDEATIKGHPDLVAGSILNSAKRQQRKRKRSVSPARSSTSTSDRSVSDNDQSSTTVVDELNPDRDCSQSQSTKDGADFNAYLDSLTEGCRELNIYGNLKYAGTFTVDTSKPIDLSDPKLIVGGDAVEDDSADDEDDTGDSLSDNSNRDDEDSNAEDNWRNDYPDEEAFENGDDDEYDRDSDKDYDAED